MLLEQEGGRDTYIKHGLSCTLTKQPNEALGMYTVQYWVGSLHLERMEETVYIQTVFTRNTDIDLYGTKKV